MDAAADVLVKLIDETVLHMERIARKKKKKDTNKKKNAACLSVCPTLDFLKTTIDDDGNPVTEEVIPEATESDVSMADVSINSELLSTDGDVTMELDETKVGRFWYTKYNKCVHEMIL